MVSTGTVKADVVVLGAGPAGCAAAWMLAGAGADVALLEQGRFPRDKVCGDGLTPRCMELLNRMGLSQLARKALPARTAHVVAPNGQSVALQTGRIGGRLPRRELDAALVEHARACGARLFLETKAVGIERRSDGVAVQTAGGADFRAAWAVLATGAGLQGLRAAGLAGRAPAPAAVGRRAYFEGADLPPQTIIFSYERDLLPAYGWIFGLREGLANVGVMTFLCRGARRGPSLSERFEAFVSGSGACRRFLARARQVGPARPATLRMGFDGGLLGDGRLLIAGDAAAGANPLTGEGVQAALLSGRLAGEGILRALREGSPPARVLAGYRAAVARSFARAYRHARLTKRMMKCPAVVNRLVEAGQRHPELADPLVRVIMEGADPLCLLRPGRLAKLLA